MPLTTADIIRRLSAVSNDLKDNEAQNIINGASATDLKNLDAEGVLRLYEALAMLPPRIYSSRDAAAMATLKANTQFQPITSTPDYGVTLVQNARKTLNYQLVSATMVTNIYAAEDKRLSNFERYIADGATIGRGQLGQPAYTDVKTKFAAELKTCVERVFIDELLSNAPYQPKPGRFDYSKYEVIVPTQYSNVIPHPVIEDFVVAGYLAIKIGAATKPARTHQDIQKFAVAVYHGMFPMVAAAQTAVGDDVNWLPVENHLKSQGNTDEVAYVNEVVK
ncbi:MAG TPA: hypothetical protein PKE69_09190 [Pyrinomonadaceae bacterium]|nr:hypothetical protein [Pyrinomonadaceae bacterium]